MDRCRAYQSGNREFLIVNSFLATIGTAQLFTCVIQDISIVTHILIVDFFLLKDIFECRTCGLTGSLCCCTECARVCHKGHDCKLKKTSPTAYCDCWEKCKCKALVTGNQRARVELLHRLIRDTDLVISPNARQDYFLTLYFVSEI